MDTYKTKLKTELLFKHAPHLECSQEDVPSMKHCAASLLEDCSLAFFSPYISNKFFQAIICVTLLMALFLGRYYACIHLALLKVFCSYRDVHVPGETYRKSRLKVQITIHCLFRRIYKLRNIETCLEFKCCYSRNRKKCHRII